MSIIAFCSSTIYFQFCNSSYTIYGRRRICIQFKHAHFFLLFLIHQRYQVVKIGKTDDRYEEKAFRFIEIVTYRKTGNWQWGHGVISKCNKTTDKACFLQIYKSTATSCNIVIKHKHGDKLEIRCSEWAKQ